MEPYKPPRRTNPSPPPAPPYVAPQQRAQNGLIEDTESWMTKHPLIFLSVSGLITASIGAVATHYIGSYLRGREERAQIRGQLAEAEAIEDGVVTNPNAHPEPDIFNRMDGIEAQLSDMARHFGVSR